MWIQRFFVGVRRNISKRVLCCGNSEASVAGVFGNFSGVSIFSEVPYSNRSGDSQLTEIEKQQQFLLQEYHMSIDCRLIMFSYVINLWHNPFDEGAQGF